MPNRLRSAASPYLQQHADNPVDWFEWGEEAFAKARAEDKPVFLSVGYSACHWCHVMAHESFEDEQVARVLNDHFVSIKVDREERPDVDTVYMGAVQALTGRGGWPMSVFTTPEGRPFYGGTYWPRDDRAGMPGFLRVLETIANTWREQRQQLELSGEQLTAHLDQATTPPTTGQATAELADHAARSAVQLWDRTTGGFGSAPKFPQAMTIDFLLAHHLRTGDRDTLSAATHSLEQMSRGGIYDHVAGGFARYSVDDVWLVPHFEKMLYDNALLLRAYTHAWQITGSPRFRRVARETADYLVREMRQPAGGFSSATDADSEGQEGKFFVWTADEFADVVSAAGEDAREWARRFGVTEDGNWVDPHGHAPPQANILSEAVGFDDDDAALLARRDRVRDALYRRREQRVHPGLDDKVITSWNALTLGALAEAGASLGVPGYVEVARACAEFLQRELVVDGALRHTWKEGHGAGPGAFAEDVAYLAQGLLTLYEADPDPRWFRWAGELAAEAQSRFADGDTGTYFSTASDAETLITRPKETWDNATPAPASVLADVQLRLAAYTGLPEHAEIARRILGAFAGAAAQAPTGFGELLRALERALSESREVAVVGDHDDPATQDLLVVYRERWRPGDVLAVGLAPDDATVPLLANRELVDGRPAAYVCRQFTCDRPVSQAADLRELLNA